VDHDLNLDEISGEEDEKLPRSDQEIACDHPLSLSLSLSLCLSAVKKEPKSQDNEIKGCKGQTILERKEKKARDPRTLNARAHRSAQW
jgi:hypothetical protein